MGGIVSISLFAQTPTHSRPGWGLIYKQLGSKKQWDSDRQETKQAEAEAGTSLVQFGLATKFNGQNSSLYYI